VQCYSLRDDQVEETTSRDKIEPLLFFENTRAILNKSDSRSRKSYSTVDCDSDEDSDEDIFNDIYADLNDLEEFQGESTEVEDIEGVEVYISSDEEDGPANLFLAEPTHEDLLSTSFDASFEEFEKTSNEELIVDTEQEAETREQVEDEKRVENLDEVSEEEIFESNLISEVSQVKGEMEKTLEKSDSTSSLKRISFIEDNETKLYSEITDSTFVLPQEDIDEHPVEVKHKNSMRSLIKFKSLRKFFGFVFSCARPP